MAGVPGVWYRPRATGPVGTLLYLHGGGYVGTSPRMYGVFAAWLCRRTGCGSSWPTSGWPRSSRSRPDWRTPCWSWSPCWPPGPTRPGCSWPVTPAVGDWWRPSMYSMSRTHHRPIAGAILFSPELDLLLDEPSVTDNADRDILPWNIPTAAVPPRSEPGIGRRLRGQPGRVGMAPDLRLLRERRDLPGPHPAVRGPPRRGRSGHHGPGGAGHVPRLPHPDALGRWEPTCLSGRRRVRAGPTCPTAGRPTGMRILHPSRISGSACPTSSARCASTARGWGSSRWRPTGSGRSSPPSWRWRGWRWSPACCPATG